MNVFGKADWPLIVLATVLLVIGASTASAKTVAKAAKTTTVQCNRGTVNKTPLQILCNVTVKATAGQKNALYQLQIVNTSGYKTPAKTIAWFNLNYTLPGQKVTTKLYEPEDPMMKGKLKVTAGHVSLRTGALKAQSHFQVEIFATMPTKVGKLCNKLLVSYAGGPTLSLAPACVQVLANA